MIQCYITLHKTTMAKKRELDQYSALPSALSMVVMVHIGPYYLSFKNLDTGLLPKMVK